MEDVFPAKLKVGDKVEVWRKSDNYCFNGVFKGISAEGFVGIFDIVRMKDRNFRLDEIREINKLDHYSELKLEAKHGNLIQRLNEHFNRVEEREKKYKEELRKVLFG